MSRCVVAIKKSNTNYVMPIFSDCLLEYFGKDSTSTSVNFTIRNGMIELEENEHGYELRHSPVCPIKLSMESFPSINNNNEQINEKINVATSVVIESADSHVLLTKRAQHMRTSPNVWVTPGGHIENNESVYSTGIREVQEETGLDISNGKISILGLWENVYPLFLGIGAPKNHNLVVYTHVLLDENHKELISKIKPNKNEVDSFCWLHSSVILQMTKAENIFKSFGKQYFIDNENIVEKNVQYGKMFNTWLWTRPEPYSGVHYCLRKWLQKNYKDRVSKF